MDTAEEPQAAGAIPHVEGSSTKDITEPLGLESGETTLLNPATNNDAPRPPRPESTHGDEDGSEDGAEDGVDDAAGNAGTDGGDSTGNGSTPAAADTPLSKNQQKKLKRQQKWEDMRDDRKRRRKEKRVTKQAQKRAAKPAAGGDPGSAAAAVVTTAPKEHVLVPVSLIFDCAFESYMRETEQISLASQITRSYAANRTATRCARIYVSSWGGKLQSRYETLLTSQHKRWNHVHFLEADFMEAARQADAAMRGEEGGTVVDVLRENEKGEADGRELKGGREEDGEKKEEGDDGEKTPSVVYLTSDSPHTLTRLEPYTSYVIGGIVDKNREKGLCYGRAQERSIRTAKLPIGDYMVMASRQVLTTNHVVEIMLSWLETGDWATAFTNVIPKRKGGHLRGGEKGEGEGEGDGAEAHVAKKGADGDDTMDLQDNGARTVRPGADCEPAAEESAA